MSTTTVNTPSLSRLETPGLYVSLNAALFFESELPAAAG